MAQSDLLKQCANQAVHLEVRAGLRPHANEAPCSDCGHIWGPSERRHEWHHYLGYAREHWFSVVVLCTSCHGKVHAAELTHCKHGHEFTPTNTTRRKNGTRGCRACQKDRESKRAKKQKAERHARGLRNRWTARKEQGNG